MNHKAIVEAESERPYNQRAALFSPLDQTHFDALNPGGQILGLWGYCLDAPDEIPGGCMRQFARHPAQYYVIRGQSLAEQNERATLAARLIAEILAEESE